MEIIFKILVGIIAVTHLGFLILQMFLWNADFVQKKISERFTSEKITAVLAHNQGLYNGFLAAGLIGDYS